MWFIIPAHVKQKNCWRFKASLGYRLCCSRCYAVPKRAGKEKGEGEGVWLGMLKKGSHFFLYLRAFSFFPYCSGEFLATPLCAPAGSGLLPRSSLDPQMKDTPVSAYFLKCLGYSRA